LREFWEEEPEAEQALNGSASIINAQRVVFNICGNKFRLVVRINYAGQTVFIRFVGTHRQYDGIDVEAI
jgi:mRNA interferase HigB